MIAPDLRGSRSKPPSCHRASDRVRMQSITSVGFGQTEGSSPRGPGPRETVIRTEAFGRFVRAQEPRDLSEEDAARPRVSQLDAPGGLFQAPEMLRPMKDAVVVGPDRLVDPVAVKKSMVEEGDAAAGRRPSARPGRLSFGGGGNGLEAAAAVQDEARGIGLQPLPGLFKGFFLFFGRCGGVKVEVVVRQKLKGLSAGMTPTVLKVVSIIRTSSSMIL